MSLNNDPSQKRAKEPEVNGAGDMYQAMEGLEYFMYSSSLRPFSLDEIREGPFVRKVGRPFIAHVREVLEYYQRGPQDFTADASPDVMIGSKDLDHGYTLYVNDLGFSIKRPDDQGVQNLMKEVLFRDTADTSAYRLQPFADTILPHTVLEAGPSSYLLSIYEPVSHATHIYGILTEDSRVQLDFLYRVKHFDEKLASPPFIVRGGPLSIYQDTTAKVHAFWYLEESHDVEKVFESDKPLEGELRNPWIDREGKLRFTCGDTSYSHELFYEDYWQIHLERVGDSFGDD